MDKCLCISHVAKSHCRNYIDRTGGCDLIIDNNLITGKMTNVELIKSAAADVAILEQIQKTLEMVSNARISGIGLTSVYNGEEYEVPNFLTVEILGVMSTFLKEKETALNQVIAEFMRDKTPPPNAATVILDTLNKIKSPQY